MGVAAPTGTVTFVFTDIEGSTRLWERSPSAMRDALERHDAIVQAAIADHGGYLFATGGDGFAAAFARAGDAVAAACRAQAQLSQEAWPSEAAIRVRMAVHTGEVVEREGNYFGTPVNQAARLMGIAHGGQVLCSAATAELVRAEVPLVDLGLHRLRDLSAPQRVFQVGSGRFPGLQTVDTVPTNLPTMVTELVGRSEEISRLQALLESERCVTLTGVGGVGKTRLALAVAAAVTSSFTDGCWFAELAAANTEAEVVQAVAAAMGAPTIDLAGLAAYVAERRALIVLDNCEHVLTAVSRVAERLLAAGRDITIVATSREPLAIDGEVVRGVRSLAVPDANAELADAAMAPAVRLFVARANATSDAFALSETNLAAVVQLCEQLDGIPLAIELAAARVRVMSPEEISRRLNDRFRLLGAGRGSLERHRTLLAAVSWSHDLLNEHERVVFRRLAVFPASFDLEAAELVVGTDLLDDVVESVVRLVDRSLVVYDPAAGRYRLLETLRQYASDRLAEAAETDAVRERHAQCYADLAAHTAGEHRTASSVKRLSTELDNLRGAANWLADRERWGDLLVFARSLFQFAVNSAPADGRRWYRDALHNLPDLEPQVRVDALGEIGMFDVTCGDYSGRASWRESIDLADELHLQHSAWGWVARALVTMYTRRDAPETRWVSERAVSVAQERGDETALITATGTLGAILAEVGDVGASRVVAEEALAMARRARDPSCLPVALVCALSAYQLNASEPDFDGARTVLEANPLDIDEAQPLEQVWLNQHVGIMHVGLGHLDVGVRHLARALRLADRVQIKNNLDQGAWVLALACASLGRADLAAQLIGYAQAALAPYRTFNNLQPWLEGRVNAALDAEGPSRGRHDTELGARLDRRGFIQLIVQAEQAAAGQSRMPS